MGPQAGKTYYGLKLGGTRAKLQGHFRMSWGTEGPVSPWTPGLSGLLADCCGEELGLRALCQTKFNRLSSRGSQAVAEKG